MSRKLSHIRETQNEKLEAEAVSWLAQLDNGSISHADRLALAEWLAHSPQHERELRRAAALWRGIDSLIDNAIEPPQKPSVFSLLMSFVELRPLRSLTVGAGAFACLVAFAVSITLMLSPSAQQLSVSKYQVAKGDTKIIHLRDGSVVHLNTNSIAEIYESDAARIVRLVRGEGFFDVEKDPKRPFQVIAGDGLVEAIGTKFSVRLFDHDIGVTVAEGSVRLGALREKLPVGVVSSAVALSDVKTNTIESGASAHLEGANVTVTKLNVAVIDQKISWLDDKLIFNGDTLETVIAEVTRYTDQEIIISDPSIRETRVGGVFPIGETELLFNALETSLEIDIVQEGEGRYYLQSAVSADENN